MQARRGYARMSVLSLLPALSRLSMHTVPGIRNISACTNPLYFRVSSVLLREPLKKKKKLDPAIIRTRQEKRKKNMEKQIRKLQKFTKQLKPINEIELSPTLIEEKEQRLRKLPPISEEEKESRILLRKDWNRYKTQQHMAMVQTLDSIFYSQQRALDELRAESEDLYQEAIQLDFGNFPFTVKGPLKTPAIENYDSPDGEYINITKKFEGEE